jgi:hypothetical protein
MTLLMNFDYSAGSKTTVPFKCRVGSYYLQSANNGDGDFFLGRPAFMRYLLNNPPASFQDVYKVESISYSKIANGHLNRAVVVLVLAGAIGGYL